MRRVLDFPQSLLIGYTESDENYNGGQYQCGKRANVTELNKVNMRHLHNNIHCLELLADILIIPIQHFTVSIWYVKSLIKWLDLLSPVWGLFKDLRACLELSKISYDGRCVPGQAVLNASVESVAHQLGKDGENGAADGIGIGVIRGLRNGGDGPVRMAAAEVLELVSELDVPVKDEELVETVQGG